MGYAPVVILLVAVTFTVAGLLNYYGNRKTFPWYAQVTAFLAWLFPFSIVVMLPIDLSSTLYRHCTSTICDEPVGYVDENFLWGFWRALYWTMFCLTWFIIPVMQSWLRSGEFSSAKRFKAALIDNLIYYGSIGALGLLFLIYVFATGKFTKKEDLLAFAMAGANAWGLFLCTIMLGYGLVQIPRSLWNSANCKFALLKLEFEAPAYKEAVVDAEAEVYEVAKDISNASKKLEESELQGLVDRLLNKCPMATDQRGFDLDDDTPALINRPYLVSLHSRVKRAAKIHDRNQARFQFLVEKATFLREIIENSTSQTRIFSSSTIKTKNETVLKIYWWYYCVWRGWIYRFLAVLFGLASLALIWSETVFNIDSVTLSIPALILQSPNIGYVALEAVSVCFIVYMCVCAYSSLFQVKYFDYKVVPEHHSDEGSLLFIGSYLCRLTFPICYNLLKMTKDEDNSVFIMFFGKSVNLAPLLGERYNDWLPVSILVFSLIFLTKIHTRILALCGVSRLLEGQDTVVEEICSEGRELIAQEKNQKRDKPVHLSPIRTAPSSKNALSEAKGAKDFLAAYKSINSNSGASTGPSTLTGDSAKDELFGLSKKGYSKIENQKKPPNMFN